MTRLYGEGLTRGWLTAQLVNLSEFSGARDKINDMQLRELVQLIISDKYFLNMAEIMLFCHRFKTGRYEKLYGTVGTEGARREDAQGQSQRRELSGISRTKNERRM